VQLSVLGGSAVATVQLAEALGSWRKQDRLALTLALHGRHGAVAERCAALRCSEPESCSAAA
jgi:hypothetical protein